MGSSKNVINFRKRRKIDLANVLGGKCCICGFDELYEALEFHHINPNTKEYSISSKANCHTLEDNLKEIQKCVLLCANCHRKAHNGFFTVDQLIEAQNYDCKLAEELLVQRDNNRTKTIINCIQCGKELNYKTKTGLCVDCYKKMRNKKISDINREYLKELIRKMSFRAIGRLYNVTDNSIKKWCDKFNLPRTKKEINKYTDEEWKCI